MNVCLNYYLEECNMSKFVRIIDNTICFNISFLKKHMKSRSNRKAYYACYGKVFKYSRSKTRFHSRSKTSIWC